MICITFLNLFNFDMYTNFNIYMHHHSICCFNISNKAFIDLKIGDLAFANSSSVDSMITRQIFFDLEYLYLKGTF